MNRGWLGDTSHLDGYSDVISSDDAEDLKRHFKLGGLDSFARSTAGGMLERAEMFSCGTKPCVRCGGHVSMRDGDIEYGGCGFIPSQEKTKQAASRKQAEMMKLMDIDVSTIPLAADEVCPDCNCKGWVAAGKRPQGPLTARPTKSSVNAEPSCYMADVNLQTMAICSRRLTLADALFSLASIVITCYLEPGGCVGLLWHLTPAGKTMLRKNKNETTPQMFFASMRVAQDLNRDKNVAAQFLAADEQAAQLLAVASQAWNAVVVNEAEIASL